MPMSRSEAGKLGAAKYKLNCQRRKQQRIEEYYSNPRICLQCGGPIPYESGTSAKFCSRSCSATCNNAKLPKRRVKVNCDYCSKPLLRVPNEKGKFCSHVCQKNLQKKRYHEQIENGEMVGSRIMKNYLIDKHGAVCLSPNCAWDFSRVKVKVELEHIDGNSENTSLSNCTLLCPNCHSLTPTYKNKNMGNGRAYRRKRYAEGKSY